MQYLRTLIPYHTSTIVRLYRGFRLVVHLLYGLLMAATFLGFLSSEKRDKVITYWSRGLISIFNIDFIVRGTQPNWQTRNTLFVANHISWFDIYALNSIRAVRFIAKIDIRAWPVLGWFVEKGNTLFIDRGKRSEAGRMLDVTVKALQNGDLLAFFPEGTTTDGTHLLPFKASLIQSAINTRATVWPVAIQYLDNTGKIDTNMGYYGEMSLAGSMATMLTIKRPVLELTYLEPLVFNEHVTRTELAALARHKIQDQLNINAKLKH